MYSVAFLVPITSNKCKWKTIDDSYLSKRLLLTVLKTVPTEYNYKFYFGIDKGEKIYTPEAIKQLFDKLPKKFNIKYDITVYQDVENSHITRMWNILYQKAYQTGEFDYYYQCGDDTNLFNKGWLEEGIKQLKEMNDIGVVGPTIIQGSGIFRILTQVLISNKHYQIFGFLFPEEIKNWWCDDWINEIYQPNNIRFLKKHLCENISCKDPCQERYIIKNIEKEHKLYVPRDKALVDQFILQFYTLGNLKWNIINH